MENVVLGYVLGADGHLHSPAAEARAVAEYDFFSEAPNKWIRTHILPLPEDPEALREFFVPELVPIPPEEDRVNKGKKKKLIKGPELVPTPPQVNKGKEKKIDQASSSSSSFFINQETRNTSTTTPNPPQFDERILGEIDVAPVFLFEKKLYGLDLYMKCNRLVIMLGSERVMRFLSGEERRKVKDGGGVSVTATEAQHIYHEFQLVLAKLEGKLGNQDFLQLKDDWSRVLTGLGLKSGDVVQAWGYRRRLDVDAGFRLALNIIRPSEPLKKRRGRPPRNYSNI